MRRRVTGQRPKAWPSPCSSLWIPGMTTCSMGSPRHLCHLNSPPESKHSVPNHSHSCPRSSAHSLQRDPGFWGCNHYSVASSFPSGHVLVAAARCVQPWLGHYYGPSIAWWLSYPFLRRLNATGTNSQGSGPLPFNMKWWRPEVGSARD